MSSETQKESDEAKTVKRLNELIERMPRMTPVEFFSYRNELFAYHPYLKYLLLEDFRPRVTERQLAQMSQLLTLIWIWFREEASVQNNELTEEFYTDRFRKMGAVVNGTANQTPKEQEETRTRFFGGFRERILLGFTLGQFEHDLELASLPEDGMEFRYAFMNFIYCFETLGEE